MSKKINPVASTQQTRSRVLRDRAARARASVTRAEGEEFIRINGGFTKAYKVGPTSKIKLLNGKLAKINTKKAQDLISSALSVIEGQAPPRLLQLGTFSLGDGLTLSGEDLGEIRSSYLGGDDSDVSEFDSAGMPQFEQVTDDNTTGDLVPPIRREAVRQMERVNPDSPPLSVSDFRLSESSSESDGQAVRQFEIARTANDLVIQQVAQQEAQMGLPNTVTEPNRGVGTDVMLTAPGASSGIEDDSAALGSTSETPAGVFTADQAVAQAAQLSTRRLDFNDDDTGAGLTGRRVQGNPLSFGANIAGLGSVQQGQQTQTQTQSSSSAPGQPASAFEGTGRDVGSGELRESILNLIDAISDQVVEGNISERGLTQLMSGRSSNIDEILGALRATEFYQKSGHVSKYIPDETIVLLNEAADRFENANTSLGMGNQEKGIRDVIRDVNIEELVFNYVSSEESESGRSRSTSYGSEAYHTPDGDNVHELPHGKLGYDFEQGPVKGDTPQVGGIADKPAAEQQGLDEMFERSERGDKTSPFIPLDLKPLITSFLDRNPESRQLNFDSSDSETPVTITQQDTQNGVGQPAEGGEVVETVPSDGPRIRGGILYPDEGGGEAQVGGIVADPQAAEQVGGGGGPVSQTGSTAGLQPGQQGYDAIYKIPMALYFNSSTSPKWDQDLNKSIKEILPGLSKDQIFMRTKSILQKYSVQLMIPTMRVGPTAPLKKLVQQYMEVLQLFFSYKRNMQNGPRNATVGVKLGDLQQFGSLLQGPTADQTSTPSPPVLPAANQAVTAQQKAVNDAIQPSNTTKVLLNGATPLGKTKYWKGESMSSRTITKLTDGIRRAGVNTGANSRYGLPGRLTIPDSKNNVIRTTNQITFRTSKAEDNSVCNIQI